MCIICVSTVTIASLLSPSVEPSLVNQHTNTSINKTFIESNQKINQKNQPNGKKCLKSQLNTTKENMICLKNGKTYRWTKKEPSINKNIEEQYIPPSVTGLDANICKINEQSNSRGRTAAGFPIMNSLATKSGKVKWALVPIDFEDIKGDANFKSRINDQMRLLSEWYYTVSEGKFIIEWVVADKWTTLSGKSTDYRVERSDNLDRNQNALKIWKEAISKSDLTFDYTGVEVVNFILPLNQNVILETVQGFPWDAAVKEYKTNEVNINAFTIPGVFFTTQGREYWSYWAHEYGHSITLAHIGSSRAAGPFHPLDIMASQDAPAKELSGWLRMLAEWIPDEKIYCQTIDNIQETTLSLVPLNSFNNGIKIAIIKINDSKILILESRRNTKFSNLNSVNSGVLAYYYDARIGHGEDFFTPVDQANGLFKNKGQKILTDGLTIEIIDSNKFDKIKITKNSIA